LITVNADRVVIVIKIFISGLLSMQHFITGIAVIPSPCLAMQGILLHTNEESYSQREQVPGPWEMEEEEALQPPTMRKSALSG